MDSLGKLYLSDWKGEISWKGIDQYYSRKRVPLPFYPFNRKPAWVQFSRLLEKLHPLLGRIVPNSSNQTIFECKMTAKNTNFVQDHVIGNTIIFPGAGFLEMALSAGYAAMQGLTEDWTVPRRPIGVRNLKIASPLAIHDSGPVTLQTVVNLDGKDDKDLSYSVSISSNSDPHNSCDGQWIPHSSATFLPVAVAKMKLEQLPKIDIPTIQKSWRKSENKEFYEKLPQIGLRFGPKFQSLQLGWRSEQGILAEVKVPQDFDSYLVHPVIGDAMFQTLMMWNNKDTKMKKKLQVPVHIGEFTWLSNSESANRYIYCSNTDAGPYAVLLDDRATPLAYMADLDFAETSVKLMEAIIQQQTSALPGMWEKVWKPKRGPLQNRLAHEVNYPTHLPAEMEEQLRQMNDCGDVERNFCCQMSQVTHCYFLEALFKLGWKPEIHKIFTLDELIATLSIQPRHKMYVRYFLRAISLTGAFEMLTADGTTFRYNSEPPTIAEIMENRQEVESVIDATRVEYRLNADMGETLHLVFTGEIDPLGKLFREDPSKVNTRDLYNFVGGHLEGVLGLTMRSWVLDSLLEAAKAQMNEQCEEPVVRILEIGAGTGALSRGMLQGLADEKMKFEYFYTDISAAFFVTAEKEFEKFSSQIVFKRFNMEEDPFEQGLCPEYFDMMLAADVLHVSKDIEKTMKNLRPLLKPGGVIQIIETIAEDPRLTFAYGLLEGYWRFEDYHIRPFHVSLSGEKWVDVLQAADFPRVEWRPAYNNLHGIIIGFASKECADMPRTLKEPKHAWLIFDDGTQLTEQLTTKLEGIGREVVIFSKELENNEDSFKARLKSVLNRIFEGILYLWGLGEDRDQAHISLPMLTLWQLLLASENDLPRVYAVTRGMYEVDDSEVLNPSSASLHGLLTSVFNEESGRLPTTIVDLSPSESTSAQMEELFQNLWFDQVDIVALRGGKRLEPKLISLRIPNECLTLPSGCDRFRLQLSQTRLISDLEFTFLDHYTLGEGEVEIQVKAYALNFKDVLTVLKPIADFDDFNAVGLDLAGVVTRVGEHVQNRKVGDRVIAFNLNKDLAMASHVKLSETLAVPLPDGMTFAEGSTLPTVVQTSYYCLIRVAKMLKGETVLIHTASGGVGLCAIQVAKHVGANIIATAGSPRKRNYLRNLGIKHVFHSRTPEFGKQILEVTNGRGVDIVLNSITGPGLKEASLDCLTQGGRFVEMSKLNVWTEDEVQLLRPDLLYSLVDLPELAEPILVELAQDLQNSIDNYIKPIPYDRFDALDVRNALNYLQKAKHIGKVVCIMPEIKVEKCKMAATTPLFNDESTYLITGGLGGIGIAVANWMLNSGAKYIVLLGRSSPSRQIVDQIESWSKRGKHVAVFSVDIGDYEQSRKCLLEIQSESFGFPPLRGVMHAAGVLDDGRLQLQTWRKFQNTFNSKVNGSWNLHELTKDLRLEHFVLFSSISGEFGSPMQANHSASNSFEDALAHYRKSNGLPATTVNWGQWGEVGVATEADIPGVRPISTSQGLLALETVLKTQKKHAVVVNVESFTMMATVFSSLKAFVDDSGLFGDNKSSVSLNSDEFWAKVDREERREDKIVVFKDFIKTIIRTLLRMDTTEEIDDNVELQSIGVDSLVILELKNGMQNVLGRRLPFTVKQMKDGSTTQLLANKLVSILEGEVDVM